MSLPAQGSARCASDEESEEHLKPTSYHYPWGQIAAIQQLFGQAGIPSLNWGDHVLGHYGVNQCCLMVALVDQLAKATEILVRAGFRHCTCTDDVRHLSDPVFNNDLSAHFLGPDGKVHLCASSLLHDLVPLTEDHPNPLGLTIEECDVPLTDAYTQPTSIRVQSEATAQGVVVRLLGPYSVTLVHLHLSRIRREQQLRRKGLGLAWGEVAFMMAADVDRDHNILKALPDGALRSDYLKMMRGLYPNSNLQ